MSAAITWQSRLSVDEATGVQAVLDRVIAADGVSAVSEQTRLQLFDGDRGCHGLLSDQGRLVGYAYFSADEQPVAELLVDPVARGRGLGAHLLAAVVDEAGPQVRIWAHGNLPAAQRLANSADLRPVRRLCRYVRALTDIVHEPLPGGFRLRTFTPDDAAQWLTLNAQVFRDLPDQGSWTSVDLDERRKQQWFDPAGFLLAFDDMGLAGFHWTKVHEPSAHSGERVGEVYVLGVADRARGTGLGSALTVAGLEYLRDLGLPAAMLYVDSSNTAAVALYTRLGFALADCEVQYATADANVGDVSGTLGS